MILIWELYFLSRLSLGLRSVTRYFKSVRLQILIFWTESSFSAILRITVSWADLIMAFLTWTASQSESVTPFVRETLFVPRKQRSASISYSCWMTWAPTMICVSEESCPPIRWTFKLGCSTSSIATTGLMVKKVQNKLLGMRRGRSILARLAAPHDETH